MSKLDLKFFDQECTQLAQLLIGKVIARKLENGKILKGIIVETEAYLGGEDKASHSYNGKITERNRPMYALPGTSYVYAIYGMYFCLNISSQGPGAAVLLRALQPTEGLEEMRSLRDCNKKKNSVKKIPIRNIDLCNGPSKLCISFNITKNLNNIFMPDSETIWIEESLQSTESLNMHIVKCPRIGIEKCGEEWASKHLRFYWLNNKYVSKCNKKCEHDYHER